MFGFVGDGTLSDNADAGAAQAVNAAHAALSIADTVPSCPAGYIFNPDDVRGLGTEITATEGIEKCADACDERGGCTSFEYYADNECATYTEGTLNIGKQWPYRSTTCIKQETTQCDANNARVAIGRKYKRHGGWYLTYNKNTFKSNIGPIDGSLKQVCQWRNGEVIWSGTIKSFFPNYARAEPRKARREGAFDFFNGDEISLQ